MYVLYEHASGYGLFDVTEFEEISMLQADVEKSVTDFGKFASLVKLHAFSPFKSGANALDNINSISEGEYNTLQFVPVFVTHLPWIALLMIVRAVSFQITLIHPHVCSLPPIRVRVPLTCLLY